MATLNIRNFPEGLLRAVKVKAAQAGITLREHVIAALSGKDEPKFAKKPAQKTKDGEVEWTNAGPAPNCPHGESTGTLCYKCDSQFGVPKL